MAASEFCARTRVWRERITQIMDEACTGYAPTLPGGAIIHEIESAWFGETRLEPRGFDCFTPEELDRHGDSERPAYITQRTSGVFRIVPRAAGTLILNMILKPPSGAAEGAAVMLPDWLLHQHGEPIANGGLARVLIMKDQAWFDSAGAQVAAGIFEAAVIGRASYNTRGQQRAPRRIGFAWV